jgi:hypothetical protein
MFRMILALLPILISFACGYGVRELISRRRLAAAREEYYQKHPEERPVPKRSDITRPPQFDDLS